MELQGVSFKGRYYQLKEDKKRNVNEPTQNKRILSDLKLKSENKQKIRVILCFLMFRKSLQPKKFQR